MDEQTLLSNQDLWTYDDTAMLDSAPVALNQSETHLYRCLIDGVYGRRVRLDIERLPLALIATALGTNDERYIGHGLTADDVLGAAPANIILSDEPAGGAAQGNAEGMSEHTNVTKNDAVTNDDSTPSDLKPQAVAQ